MIRSWLYVSGRRPEHFEKALRSPADVVVFDLEDSVPSGEKSEARAAVSEFLDQRGGARSYVRVNALDTEEAEFDLDALATVPLAGYRIPKAEDAEAIRSRFETQIHSNPDLVIQPLIETAVGLSKLEELLSIPHVSGVAFGDVDLAADLRLDDVILLEPLHLQAVVTCRAQRKLPPAQSVWTHLNDHEGLRESTRRGWAMGFRGRSAIHPTQIETIHAAAAPSPESLAHARATLDVLGDGASSVLTDGTFVDEAAVRMANERIASHSHSQRRQPE